MTEQTAKPTVTIDDVAYDLDTLDAQTQNMIGLYQKWVAQAQEMQSELAKVDLAVKGIAAEISKRVKPPTAPSTTQ